MKMSTLVMCLSVAMIGGLLMSRLAKKLNLPAVTAYLVAGLLLGPYCLGALHIPGLGFNTLEQVDGFSVISQVAMAFIAFTIGNEFRLTHSSIIHNILLFALGNHHYRCGRVHLLYCRQGLQSCKAGHILIEKYKVE